MVSRPPAGLNATSGVGQVTLSWDDVDGAAGYLVHVAESPDGPFEPLDHQGRDVLAVPHGPYADTTGKPGQTRWYAVAAVADVERVGSLSSPVAAASVASGSVDVDMTVDVTQDQGELERPWRPMIGSEHLSHALAPAMNGGREIGAELRSALRAAHEELGVRTVRAHGILCDDVGVYREVDGRPVYNFDVADRVYDMILDLGLRPCVELSFMPRDLAADPTQTVFAYNAIISPPKDWNRWRELVQTFVAHLVNRYGLNEVRERWSFEIWNEANLDVFWSGTREEYFRLYDLAADAVTSVDAQLRVGGPASAASGWIEPLLDHVDQSGARLDFVSTHTYGSPPLDLRPVLRAHDRGDTPLWWTEWGVTPTHFNEVSESVFAAVFLLRGMLSAMGRIEALSYWVVSDHFEEWGPPPELFHGGFGLRSVGELRKPRWWALAVLERLPSQRVAVILDGDGADSLVEGVAARDPSSRRVAVLVWNGTLDQSKAAGSVELSRRVTVRIDGLDADVRYTLHHYRVDDDHSCVPAVWRRIRGDAPWPTDDQWDVLRAADHLEELHEPYEVTAPLEVAFDLPMPSMSLLELVPQSSR